MINGVKKRVFTFNTLGSRHKKKSIFKTCDDIRTADDASDNILREANEIADAYLKRKASERVHPSLTIILSICSGAVITAIIWVTLQIFT